MSKRKNKQRRSRNKKTLPSTVNLNASELTEKKEAKAKFQEIGRSGTFITGDTVQNDYLNEFIGIDGQILCEKITKSDSQVRKVYHALANPIRSAKWAIEPASDDPKDLDVAALIEQILFKDLPDGWIAKLDEILTFPWHGHSVFEVIHKNRTDKKIGNYTGLANLAFRDQRTLDKWKYSPEGLLTTIHQLQSGDIEVNVDIPAEDLIIFYNEKKGNDTGYPFCRMIYGNYKRKLLYKQLQAIGIERAAIPVPHLELPDSVEFDSPEYKDAVEQLAAFTQAEQAFFITPNGYILNYNQTKTYDPAKVQVAIKAENEEISGSVVAMFLEMGIGGNAAVGSSTGEAVKFFKDGIEYIADKVADTMNLKLIDNLVRLNFGDTVEVNPKLVHSGIADEAGKELMEVVTGYVKDGVITADEPLEDHIRKTHNLPKKAEGELIDNGKSKDDKENPTPPDDDPAPGDGLPKEDDVELSTKGKPKTPKALIERQAPKISADLKRAMDFSSAKYINDVMARYKQLPDAKKQKATDKVKMGGQGKLKKALRSTLSKTVNLSIAMARTEVPTKKNIELSNSEPEMLRMIEKYGDISEIKLNDVSDVPSHLQVLVLKQSELISDDTLTELKKRIDFSFSGIERKEESEAVIRQRLEEEADKFTESAQITLKGTNAASLMVNEGRDTFFFDPEVLEEIHSFTFVNIAPVSAVCRELAGTTFNTNDASSLRFTPPLHHNCKSYLRANLKTSKGTEKLEVSKLAPSAEAQKSITL